MIPERDFFVGEVALSQVVPLSVDRMIVPDCPTATKTPEPDVFEEDEEEDEEDGRTFRKTAAPKLGGK